MILKWKCIKCNIDYPIKYLDNNKGKCYLCNKEKEVVKEIEIVEEINKPSVTENKIKDSKIKVYTSSYLNHTLKMNLNSIKNERWCIKVNDWYILHNDIIEEYKNRYLL